MQTESENLMTRYLLGELSDAEMSALEARYFEEPEVFDQVVAAETQLVDDYGRNRLSPAMRERFERSYMAHPERRERMRFGEAFTARLDQIEQPAFPASRWQSLLSLLGGGRPALRFSMAMAALLITMGGVWLFIELQRSSSSEVVQAPGANVEVRPDPEQNKPEAEPPANREPEVKSLPPGNTPQPIPSPSPEGKKVSRSVYLALAVGGVRGNDSGSTPVLVIPSGTTQARLSLTLKENEHSSYRLSLRTISGTEIARRSIAKPVWTKNGANLVLTVPSSKFSDGDYVLTLTGVADDGEAEDFSRSLFRVKRIN